MLKRLLKRMQCPPLSKKEQGLFAERLSLLLGASLSLPESVAVMRNAFGKGRRRAFGELERSLDGGLSFELSLARSPLRFSRTIILAARIGERSGTLAESLRTASGRIERSRAVKNGLASAAMYPAIVFLASAGIVGFLVFFIFPKIMPTIQSLHVPLPPVTVFFMAVSHFLVGEWQKMIAAAVLACIALFLAYTRSSACRAAIQRALLSVPLAKGIIRAHILSELFDTLSTLVSAGCPFVEAVSESAASTGFVAYRRALKGAVQEMQSGSGFSSTVRRHPLLFPEFVADSVAIGERTGNMETVLPHIGHYYARELEMALAAFSKLIEPALMVSVGVIVGAAALSIVLPIYGISQHLSR